MQHRRTATRVAPRACTGDREFFRHIRQIQAPWHSGSIPLPTFYYEAMAIQADLLASSRRVRSFLPSSRMHPLRVLPGRCVVVVAALSYADTDLGPYNELLVGVPFTLDEPSPQFSGVLRQLPHLPQIYVHRLPVTTEIARGPGLHFLAAPKFIADISFEETDEYVRCRVAEEGNEMLTMEVRKGELKQAGRWRADVFTAEKGYLLRWAFVESEQRKRVSHDRSDARLVLGSHPVAHELREMRLGRVLSCEYRPRFAAVLGPVVENFRANPEGEDESEPTS